MQVPQQLGEWTYLGFHFQRFHKTSPPSAKETCLPLSKNIVTSLVSSELTRNFIAPQKILLSRVAIDCAWFLQDLRLLLDYEATILLLYCHPTVTTKIHPGKQLQIDWNRFDEIADLEKYLNRNLNSCQNHAKFLGLSISTPPKFNNNLTKAPAKIMVGKLLSFQDGKISGAILNFVGVRDQICDIQVCKTMLRIADLWSFANRRLSPWEGTALPPCRLKPGPNWLVEDGARKEQTTVGTPGFELLVCTAWQDYTLTWKYPPLEKKHLQTTNFWVLCWTSGVY